MDYHLCHHRGGDPGLVFRSILNDRPKAVSAAAFIKARDTESETARHTALAALVDDVKITPFYRAKAAIELCQESLTAGKASEAKSWSTKASEAAKLADSSELSLAAAGLSEGAVAEDSGDLDGALARSNEVQKVGAKSVSHFLMAVYGAARVESTQGKYKEAVERLDLVVNRSDELAKPLLPMLQSLYWTCKRKVDGDPTTTVEPKKADPSALLPTNLPAVPVPAVPAPAVPAPAAPAVPSK